MLSFVLFLVNITQTFNRISDEPITWRSDVNKHGAAHEAPAMFGQWWVRKHRGKYKHLFH